jgi:hypothetical protein
MLAAHTGMNISAAEFNTLVGDLLAALDFYDVPEAEKSETSGDPRTDAKRHRWKIIGQVSNLKSPGSVKRCRRF